MAKKKAVRKPITRFTGQNSSERKCDKTASNVGGIENSSGLNLIADVIRSGEIVEKERQESPRTTGAIQSWPKESKQVILLW
uniref:Uncharacterized protein n=1 Tax=Cannabis sativa TaxID=3483 RepID=A0A803PY41_CANSA